MGFGLNFNNFINFWRELFWGMLPYNKGGGHESAILAGSPMMNIFAFLFFLIGIIRAITRRSLADKICLVWIGVTIFTFSVLSVSHPRYILFGAPAFYLLSGLGFVSSWQLISQAIVNFKNFKLKILSYSALLLIFSFTLIYSFYWIYQDFFIKFPKVGINNTYYQGSKELADYILNNFDPKKDQLVFSDLTLINYEIFFFNTLGNFYPVISWYNIIQNLSDDSKALQYADFVSWRANTYQAMQSWEEKILTEKEKIIYIFSASPGYPYYFSLGGGLNEKFIQNKILDNFYELHLGIKPQKIIYYPPGNPHYAIFIVDRNTPRNYFWNIGENKNFLYQVNDTKELKTFFIKFGFPQNLKIATNSQYLEFPLGQASSNLKKVAFASSGKSFLTFEASFSKEENFGSFEAKNLKFYQQKNNSLKWVELSNNLLVRENGGYMTYKINSPYNITHLEVNIYYTFFNDLEKENEITLYYSLDNKNYQEAFRIKSDGSKNIIGPGADFSGEIKNLNSKEFYLKFVLRGKPGQVQLWSIKDLPISFIAKTNLDSFPGLKLTKVENLLKIIQEKEDKDLRIIF